VAFGVRPTRPETGYGYVATAPGPSPGILRIAEFIEKPDEAAARWYLAAGTFLWNSGMFLFRADAWQREVARHAPDMAVAIAAALLRRDGDDVMVDARTFAACPVGSIDRAVMEKTDSGVVIPLDAGWEDAGSYAALREIGPRDPAGNALRGDVLAIDTRDSYVRSQGRLVGVIGLDGCVVVETPDAVLVAPLARSQEVTRLVEELEARGRSEAREGREVMKPWGSYDSLARGPGFRVKRLTVLPGGQLSLQMHQRRAEHWVVVSGRARVTCDDDVRDLRPGDHAYIPAGARHRIENAASAVLHIIEVQVGDHLGEDDIVRFEDRYGRAGRTD
jgi:mannose-1-phosphate guanylyltransferase/mannose-6-phosphate isomerase